MSAACHCRTIKDSEHKQCKYNTCRSSTSSNNHSSAHLAPQSESKSKSPSHRALHQLQFLQVLFLLIVASNLPLVHSGHPILPIPIPFLSTSASTSTSTATSTVTSTVPATMPTESSKLRQELLEIIGKNPSGHLNDAIREEFSSKLSEYSKSLSDTAGANGGANADADGANMDKSKDVIFAIGKSVFGVTLDSTSTSTSTSTSEEPAAKKQKTSDENGAAGSNSPKAVAKEPDAEPEAKAEPDVIIDFDYMKQFMKDVFLTYGCTPDQAETSSEVLIEADKRGIDSHGLGRLKPIYCDRIDKGILWPNKQIDVLKETETTALVDGNLGLGLYIGPYCMQMAIDKAKKYGVGFVACQNSTHYGIAGYYASMATEAGCVGFTGTNARPSIAPTFGVEPMLGTNPLVFGIPSSDEFPFIIDCATSINQRGKIEKYARDGVDTPKGAVIDVEGIERTDTDGILRDMVLGKCALTPLGGAGEATAGYKGYGWATVVELLCTAFQSGPFGEDICGVDRETGKPKPMPLGHFFLAINIESLCSLDTFERNTGNLLKALRESKKSPLGPGRIWTAGEKENDARVFRTGEQGGMKVPGALQQNMIDLREAHPTLKEKYGKFPFEE